MVRTVNRSQGDPLLQDNLRKRSDGKIEGRIGVAMAGVDPHDGGKRPFEPRLGKSIDLACLRLLCVGLDPAQTMTTLPGGFGGNESPCNRVCIGLVYTIAHQSVDNQRFRRR